MDKFKEFISEGSAAFDRAVAQIASLTDRNAHADALVAGAKLLKHKKLQGIFGGIAAIHDNMGHLPFEIGQFRHSQYQVLMKYAESKLSKEDYDKFYEAY